MAMTHCFFDENGKVLFCIPIYLMVRKLIPKWWWSAEPSDPSPWRYLEQSKVPDELQRDITTIALIDELASTLGRGRDKAIKDAVHSAVRDLQLPKGMTVSLNPQPIPPGRAKGKPAEKPRRKEESTSI